MDEVFTGTLAVVGLGYIGLPTAVALATRGVDVVGIDTNEEILTAVRAGRVPFAEPDLAVGVSGAVAMGHLTVSDTVPQADAYIIAVPTPFQDDRTADLSYIKSACESIAPTLRTGAIVVLESTSPPGTTDQVSRWLGELRPDLTLPHCTDTVADIHVAHCPERVLPGRIMIEMVTNDRVVGGMTPGCAARAASIYRVFAQGEILLTDAASAEMAKLVENTYRDVNIALANELSLICESLHLDVWEVIELANRHPRVNVLTPGPGVGGHCIAVDPWFIVGVAPTLSKLIRTAREINDAKPEHVADEVIRRCGRFRDPVVACLGLTFKANVDDTRESPAVDVVNLIAQGLPGVDVLVADPYVKKLPERIAHHPNLQISSATDAVDRADIVVLLVDHDQFKTLPRRHASGKVVYDTRGAWR